jgi:predicted glycosyltransferase
MKRIMFYCQHILGIGHLIRSMEIVRGLTPDFQVSFINGGEIIAGFQVPEGVEVINLPAIKTDSEFQALQVPDGFDSIEALLEHRRDLLLNALNQIQPDTLIVELFPFGRRKFSTELVPLLEQAKAIGTKTVCSLRDIVVTKQDRQRHEEKVCKLMNRHFDMLLIHGDPQFMPLETSFSRVKDLKCEVHYTGYVVQEEEVQSATCNVQKPIILVSVGGGRFGHELLDCVAEASAFLEERIPHHIQMFAGPFSPDDVLERLQTVAVTRSNLSVDRYTPSLLSYMHQADLSISMAGYNTTMNILTTGVRSMLLPFTGNDDQEQRIRSERLEELGVVQVIRTEDLQPERFAEKVVQALQQQPIEMTFDLDGVAKTSLLVRSLAEDVAQSSCSLGAA